MARMCPVTSLMLFLLIALLTGCAAEQAVDSVSLPDATQPRLHVQIDTKALSYLAMKQARFTAIVSGVPAYAGISDYSYIWDFNAADGRDVDGFQSSVQHIYPEPGQYTISLHVAYSSGASGEAAARVDIKEREYTAQKPVEIYDLVSSPDRPYIIDGHNITNPHGDGISLRRCENIIIRNCYIHDCREGNDGSGRAIYAEDCHNLTIQNVYVKNNERGILVEGNPDHLSSNILVESNVVVRSEREDGISFRNVEDVETRGNILYDNGRIWEDRISGISFNGAFHDISIHHNMIVRSNSDAVELSNMDRLMGDIIRDPAMNVDVYANVLRDNGEQGVWLFRVRNSRVHDNYIAGSHNNGVFLEGWVSNVCIDHNTIVRCGGIPGEKHHGGGAVGVQYSRDNIIRSNILIDSTCGDVAIGYPGISGDWAEGMDNGFLETAGNVVDGNVMCSSEVNISIADGVSSTSITNNIVWQRKRGHHYHGCRPDRSNIEAMPLFRAPERGDFALLSSSPGYDVIKGGGR